MENQQQTSTLCRAGCGFFGSPSTDGLCSKCYKDYLKRKQDTARVSPTMPPSGSSGADTANATSSTVSSTCNAGSTAATTSTVTIAGKIREVSSSFFTHCFELLWEMGDGVSAGQLPELLSGAGS